MAIHPDIRKERAAARWHAFTTYALAVGSAYAVMAAVACVGVSLGTA